MPFQSTINISYQHPDNTLIIVSYLNKIEIQPITLTTDLSTNVSFTVYMISDDFTTLTPTSITAMYTASSECSNINVVGNDSEIVITEISTPDITCQIIFPQIPIPPSPGAAFNLKYLHTNDTLYRVNNELTLPLNIENTVNGNITITPYRINPSLSLFPQTHTLSLGISLDYTARYDCNNLMVNRLISRNVPEAIVGDNGINGGDTCNYDFPNTIIRSTRPLSSKVLKIVVGGISGLFLIFIIALAIFFLL
jgi:hypothetical protein